MIILQPLQSLKLLVLLFSLCFFTCFLCCPCVQVYEILDNAIDEAQAGYASKVDVVLHEDNSASITDNGRGVCAS